MVFRYEYPGGVWVDLEQPTGDEIRSIAREFSISERIETELLSPTPSSLTAGDTHAALLVLHFPAHDGEEHEVKNQEIDFIVGTNFIVTVRYEIIAPLHRLKKLLEAQQLIEHETDIGTDVLLEILFAHLYTAIHDLANHAADNLARAERGMFRDRERDTVRSISIFSREFLHLESALASQEESLGHFLRMLSERDFFGPSFTERAKRIEAERRQMARLIKTHRAIATELRETNIALLNVRQNEIMKTLTTVNLIFLPLGLISWTFAMRTEGGMPFIEHPNGYWVVLGIMLGLAALLILYFAKKRWL